MPTFTPNLNLKKPVKSENYNVDVFNENCDIIDTYITTNKQNKLVAGKNIALIENLDKTTTISTSGLQENNWIKNKSYIIGDICYPSNYPSSLKLECIVAGTSGNLEPSINPVWTEFLDGTVKWIVTNVSFYSLGYKILDLTQFIKCGELQLPPLFPRLPIPFKIYKDSHRKFSHKVTPDTQYDWSTATQIYISCTGTSVGLGTDYYLPISLSRFKSNQTSALYPGVTKFVLNLLDNIYLSNLPINIDGNLNYLIRSMSSSGFTWLQYKEVNINETFNGLTWSAENGIFKTTINSSLGQKPQDIINFTRTDKYGMPYPYIKVSTLVLCQATKGTFYSAYTAGTGWDVWVNPYAEDNIGDLLVNHVTNLLTFNNYGGIYLMLENIGFTIYDVFTFMNSDVQVYFWGCKFYRGFDGAFQINGRYNAYLFDCVAAYASNDGFNYHATNKQYSLGVEINCISYGNGKHKLEGNNGLTHSNNCSTAHDGMYMLRVGGRYWECEGPVVADVNDTYSISIGCETYDILNSTTGERSGFYVYNDSGITPINKKYFIECLVSGKYFTTAYQGTTDTYYLNCEGVQTMGGGIQRLNSWEDVVNA